MSDLTKGVEFTNNEQVTATKLNNLVDDATINTGAVGSDELAVDAVTTDKVQDGAITRDKLAEDAMGVKSIQQFSGTTRGTEVLNLNGTDGDSVDSSKAYVINNSDSGVEGSNTSSSQTVLEVLTLTDTSITIDVRNYNPSGFSTIPYYYNLTLVEHY